MATAQAKEKTKKRPPAFTHLPQQRAKKLKQAWVEKQKIKSQWKAAQRKEGLLTSRRMPSNSAPSSGANDGDQGGDSESGADFGSGEPDVHVQPGRTRSAVFNNHVSAQNDSDRSELRRQAYSPSSLNADPLGRRRGTTRGDRGRGGRGATPASGRTAPSNDTVRGHARGKGRRSQPDMRLRMNAMLEKIKRDFA